MIRQCSDGDGRKVLNGTRGTVTRANQDGLRLQPDQGAAIDLSPETVAASVSHGYALTIHKAQGLTAATALVVGNGLTRQSAYTALSRGRERNQLYLHEDPDAPRGSGTAFQRLCEQLSRRTATSLPASRYAAWQGRWQPPPTTPTALRPPKKAEPSAADRRRTRMLLTVDQAAERLGTSTRFIRRLRFEGRIAVIKLGKHIRIDSDDLDAFIKAGRQEPSQ